MRLLRLADHIVLSLPDWKMWRKALLRSPISSTISNGRLPAITTGVQPFLRTQMLHLANACVAIWKMIWQRCVIRRVIFCRSAMSLMTTSGCVAACICCSCANLLDRWLSSTSIASILMDQVVKMERAGDDFKYATRKGLLSKRYGALQGSCGLDAQSERSGWEATAPPNEPGEGFMERR